MKREFKISPKVLGVLSLFVVLMLCAQAAFSRCGTYFKLNYRAVNTITVTNGSYFVLGDWTGDGRSDFYNFQPNSATQTQNVIIYPGKQTGYWDWDNPIIYTTTILASTLLNSSDTKILKDFDSDGRIDFLFNNRIYRNAGNGSLTALNPVVLTQPVVLKTLAYSDINGDNLLDWIYSAHISPVGEELRYQLVTADGAFATAVTILTASAQNGLTGSSKNAADFDGDGKIDIVYTTGLNYRFLKGLDWSIRRIPMGLREIFIPSIIACRIRRRTGKPKMTIFGRCLGKPFQPNKSKRETAPLMLGMQVRTI